MTRFLGGWLCATLAALALTPVLGGAARADPPLWRVHSPHAEVDLFGSVHLLSAAQPWRTPAEAEALAKADQLWFEVPINAQTQVQAGVDALRLGLLPAGQTLAPLIGPALDARVSHVAELDGLPPSTLERMKPWLAELMLTTLYLEHHGADPALGVEQQIAKAAPPSAAREAFETVDEQIALFANDSIADQIASLKQTLDEIDTDPGLFNRLADAWMRGDIAGLVREVITPMRRDAPGVYDRLLVDRNRRFAARIEQMLQGSDRVFVVVGVGHLIGPDGVPTLLRRDGVKVDGP